MFRPTLALLASCVAGAADARAVTLAAVVELVHLATLVHDDSVDHSTLRRGMPTINSLFTHQMSVIMGDFLYSRAVVELVRLGDSNVLRVLARATNEMTHRRDAPAHRARRARVRRRATTTRSSGPRPRRSCRRRARSARSPAAARIANALARYGEQLGMAFQVADDLLDYTATSADTGKPTGLDLREHKVTLPLIAALRTMPDSARRHVERLFAAPEPSDADIELVITIVVEHGGLDYARRRGGQYAREAERALDGLPDTPVLAALHDAIAYAMDRRH